jgi:short-subunit dehydrogenase
MKTVVITGSTKGIGLGLAENFLARGHRVVVSGRRQADVDRIGYELQQKYSEEAVFGRACDVGDLDQVQGLWDASRDRYDKVDIWISNAGQANTIMDFWKSPEELIESVVRTNVIGQMFSAKVAISGMLEQGFGAYYLMEGKGSEGRVQPGLTLYSTTKRAGNYLFDALVVELKDKPVIVGSLSPGMVVTALLTNQREADPESWERNKRIFNILAEKVETVAPVLVEKILDNTKSGVKIRYSSSLKIMWRFLTAGIMKRDVLGEEG